MTDHAETSNDRRNAILMIAVSITCAVIGFAFSIFLGRLLGPEGFQKYAVAIASLTLMGTVCEMGTGKYAMRVIPDFIGREAWGLAAGYWRFGLLLVLLCSLLVGAVVISLEYGIDGKLGNHGIGFAVLFLPTTALGAVAAEWVIANRAAIIGSLIMRGICPAASFVLVLFIYWNQGSVSPSAAIICFGLGGIVGLISAVFLFFKTASAEALAHRPEFQTQKWFRNCLWYALIAFLMSWVFKISVIVLDAAKIDDLEVARFAAAFEVASLVLLIGKSTNKFYQPELALIMGQNNWSRALRLKQNRTLLIGSACLAYLGVMFLFGQQILAWFGPEFVDGYAALCFMSIGTCTTTFFSMAPEYLKFADKLKTVLGINCLAGIALIAFTWMLSRSYGATGAGLAFGLVIPAMSIAFYLIANRHLKREIANHPRSFD